MQKRETIYLSGTFYWVKIFGEPRPNYDGDAREWTLEFEPDEDGVAELEARDLADRLKDKRNKKGYEDRQPFLVLKRNEMKQDGTKNTHIRVVDAANQDWTGGLIGNGSKGDMKITIVDYGPRKKAGIYPTAVRVLDHVAYEREEFAPLAKDDKRRVAAVAKRQVADDQFRKDFGMEDEPAEEEVVAKPSKRKAPVADGDLDDEVPF